MKRVIVDYHNLTPDILKLIKNKYPEGYTDTDMIVFKNTKNETIKAIEVATKSKDYLIKISKQLSIKLEDYLELDDISFTNNLMME
ncbi:MAG: hypothetical protein ABFR32_04060 [Bacteroidota bacterium]